MPSSLERFWLYLDKPLTQAGFAMGLAIIATIVPSKIGMVVAGVIFLVAAHREGWFQGQKWHVALGRVAGAALIIVAVLTGVWATAWRLREVREPVNVTQQNSTSSPPTDSLTKQPAEGSVNDEAKKKPGRKDRKSVV